MQKAVESALPSASVHSLFFLLSHCLIGDNPGGAFGGRQKRSVLLFIHPVPFLSHRSCALLSLILGSSGGKFRNQEGERRRERTIMRNDGKQRHTETARERASSPAEEEE